jgi:hypothetical protein
MADRDYKRDAVRILFILNAGKSENKSPELSAQYPFLFRGEKRLQAMDFWVRNPDYLALELIDQFHSSGDSTKLEHAKAIYADGEPSLRTIPMLRKHFGAYEPLDTALAILECRALVRPQRVKTAVGSAHYFHLPELAPKFCERIAEEFPLLGWYRQRAALVAEVAGTRSGNELKDKQHARREYHDTRDDHHIPTITDWVKAELEKLGQ